MHTRIYTGSPPLVFMSNLLSYMLKKFTNQILWLTQVSIPQSYNEYQPLHVSQV